MTLPWVMILLFQQGGHIPGYPTPPMTNTTWTYIGREGKAYLVTDGIRTKYLTAREFRTFTWS